jgi:hypothetical protein
MHGGKQGWGEAGASTHHFFKKNFKEKSCPKKNPQIFLGPKEGRANWFRFVSGRDRAPGSNAQGGTL